MRHLQGRLSLSVSAALPEHLADGRARRVRLLREAGIFRVISHADPIVWLFRLNLATERVVDRLALRIAQRRIGTGRLVAKG